jgi:two-component system, cell cycle response regulator DivK
MDLSMLEMDGWEAIRRIKQNSKSRSIPLLSVTTHALPGDRQHALEGGCDEYITNRWT